MPRKKSVPMSVEIPIEPWRGLVTMASEDVREMDNFIVWLIWSEVQRRGYISGDVSNRKKVFTDSQNETGKERDRSGR